MNISDLVSCASCSVGSLSAEQLKVITESVNPDVNALKPEMSNSSAYNETSEPGKGYAHVKYMCY